MSGGPVCGHSTPTTPPSGEPAGHSVSMSEHAPVAVWSTGFRQGMHSSPSPQPSGRSKMASGLSATSGMHFERHAPSVWVMDDVHDGGRYLPPPLMIGSGMHTPPPAHAERYAASAGATWLDGTQCEGPLSQHETRPAATGS